MAKKQFYLKRRTQKRKVVKFAVADIEANNWIDFEMLGFYDGKKFRVFHSIAEFLDAILVKKYRGWKIFAHHGGKYDFLFILQEFLEQSSWEYSLVLQGSRVLAITVKKNKNTWTFADSMGLFPGSSLKRLTKGFAVEHKKLDGEIDFSGGERVSRNNKFHLNYLRHDCLGLWEVIEKFLSIRKVNEEGLNLTIATQALRMWQRTLKTPIKVSPQVIQNFVRESYCGGRTEIFKMSGDNLFYYDVNSLYPYCMTNFPIPTEYIGESKKLNNQLGFYDVTVTAPGSYIPILPVRHTDDRGNKKLLFPNGTFRGIYFSEELKLAIEHGYKIQKVHKGHTFYRSSDLFTEYIEYFYNLKTNSEKDSAPYWTSKYLLNALYGKFGEKEEKKKLKLWEGEPNYTPFHSQELYEKTGLIEVEEWRRSHHMLAHIAAAITSYARIHMLKTCYLPDPEAAHYTDTDSILTPNEMPTGKALGEIHEEKSGLSGVFKLPKTYYLERQGEKVDLKMKGFSPEFKKTIFRKEFEDGDLIEKTPAKPLTMKRSLISNGVFLSKAEQTKRLIGKYTKRRILNFVDTEPWELKNGVIINAR